MRKDKLFVNNRRVLAKDLPADNCVIQVMDDAFLPKLKKTVIKRRRVKARRRAKAREKVRKRTRRKTPATNRRNADRPSGSREARPPGHDRAGVFGGTPLGPPRGLRSWGRGRERVAAGVIVQPQDGRFSRPPADRLPRKPFPQTISPPACPALVRKTHHQNSVPRPHQTPRPTPPPLPRSPQTASRTSAALRRRAPRTPRSPSGPARPPRPRTPPAAAGPAPDGPRYARASATPSNP